MIEKTYFDLALDFLINSWLYVGAVSSIIACSKATHNMLKEEGYLELANLLIMLAICFVGVLLGYVSLVILIYLFKDYYKDFFNALMKIKVYKTKKYRTEQLLYKEHEDE